MIVRSPLLLVKFNVSRNIKDVWPCQVLSTLLLAGVMGLCMYVALMYGQMAATD